MMQDPSSQSNPDEVLLTDLDWTANVDFEKCRLDCKAIYTVEIQDTSERNGVLKLDTKHLSIDSVFVNGEILSQDHWSLGLLEKEHLGQCLTIGGPLSSSIDSQKKVKVTVCYSTSVKSTALQWLPPSQTAGKVYPYLFTQCQAIHARSLLPCQDCPGVKMTYRATITTPHWATAIMSALSTPTNKTVAPSNDTKTDDTTTTKTYTFDQPVPISSYLFALAVGEICSHTISPRCQIWSEPSVLSAAAKEFEPTTELFITAAEDITGLPYQWTRYDLLVLPPSFPYGGMENPCLTFVTPTLITGDGSLVDVVAHEIAHSWTGNLVTNRTWEHFWLNEGWTMFLQRKIMAKVNKDDRYFHLDAIGGWKTLQDSVKLLPPEYTSLMPDLGDGDPDDAFSSVPYEKGFNLLYSIEQKVGIPAFDEFVKAYLQKFKFVTVTSQQFQDFVMDYFSYSSNNGNKEVPFTFDWDTWLHAPGMPPETPVFDSSLSKDAADLAEEWMSFDNNNSSTTANNSTAAKPPVSSTSFAWSSDVTCCFLDALQTHCDERQMQPCCLTLTTVHALKEAFQFHTSHNAEILSRFCKLAVNAADEDILDVTVRLLTTQGRMKFVRPLYRALYDNAFSRRLAVDTFRAHCDFYHPIAAKMVAADLKVGLVIDDESGAIVVVEGEDDGVDNSAMEEVVAAPLEVEKSYRKLMYVAMGLSVAGLIVLRRRK